MRESSDPSEARPDIHHNITDSDICDTMITAPSGDDSDNDNAQLFTLTVKSISQGRSTPLCLWPGLIWSGDTTQVGIQRQKLHICEMCRIQSQGEAQISTGEGRERNAECDPSWADHYYGQGTHDTAASM